jgi:hypothetical protein
VTNGGAPCPAICSPIKGRGSTTAIRQAAWPPARSAEFNGLTLPLPEG